MGVIQSSINQAAQIGAAIYKQTPKYQKKVSEAQKIKESKNASEKGKQAYDASKAPNISKEQSEYAQEVAQEYYEQAFKTNPNAENLQNIVFNKSSKVISSAANNRAAEAVKFEANRMYELYNRFNMYEPSGISKVENPRSWYSINYPGDKHIKGGK